MPFARNHTSFFDSGKVPILHSVGMSISGQITPEKSLMFRS